MDNEQIIIIKDDMQFTCEHVAELEGFEGPLIASVYVDPPEQDGSIFINSRKRRRILAWKGLLLTNIREQSRLLSKILYTDGLKTFKFTTCDGLALQFDAELNKLVNKFTDQRTPYLIEVTAGDHKFYSQEQHSASTGVTISSGGLPIPAAIPAPIGGGSSLTFIINNAGNEYSSPELTVRGPGTNFLIQNITTGEKINLNLTLTANETAVLDTRTNKAFKGNQIVYGSVVATPNGRWLRLKPGDNTIVFNAQTGKSVNTLLTVKWRDAYIAP